MQQIKLEIVIAAVVLLSMSSQSTVEEISAAYLLLMADAAAASSLLVDSHPLFHAATVKPQHHHHHLPSSSSSLLLSLQVVYLAVPTVFIAASGCRCHCHHQQLLGDSAASREVTSSSYHLSLAQHHHQPCWELHLFSRGSAALLYREASPLSIFQTQSSFLLHFRSLLTEQHL